MAQQLFQFVVGRVRVDEAHQLHLVELVLADHALGVLAVGAGLGAEAGRVGAVGDGQLALGQGRVAVDVGHRDLGRGDEVVVGVAQAEEVLFEFRELAGAHEALAVDDDRGHDLVVAVLHGLHVEHEADERPFHASGPALQEHEAAARDLGRGFEVQAPQGRSQLPVLLGGEVQLGLGAPGADLHVVRVVHALGDRRVRDVGDGHDPLLGLAVDVLEFLVQGLDARGHGPELGQKGVGVLAGFLHAGDVARGLVAAGLELLGLQQEVAALLVDGQELVEVELAAPLAQAFLDVVGVGANEFDVEHGRVLVCGVVPDRTGTRFQGEIHSLPRPESQDAQAGRGKIRTDMKFFCAVALDFIGAGIIWASVLRGPARNEQARVLALDGEECQKIYLSGRNS
ncbi:hypothetical protein DSECCO2_481830 [anaerobic digester metagenome]